MKTAIVLLFCIILAGCGSDNAGQHQVESKWEQRPGQIIPEEAAPEARGAGSNAGEATLLDRVGFADYSIERQLAFYEEMTGRVLSDEHRAEYDECWKMLSSAEKDEVLSENQSYPERRRIREAEQPIHGGYLALPIQKKCARPM